MRLNDSPLDDSTDGGAHADPGNGSLLAVLAVDGSDESVAVAQQAPRVIPGEPCWHIANVVPDAVDPNLGTSGFAGPVIGPDEARDLHRSNVVDADGANARAAHAVGPVPVNRVVLTGEPGPELCGYAERVGADVIVVGQSTGGPTAAVLGSVADYVVRHAPCPVLVVPRSAEAATRHTW